jgi:hypothetical protein
VTKAVRFIAITLVCLPLYCHAGGELPLSTTFKGQSKFDSIVRKAVAEQWSQLPIGQRMVKIAKELEGVPYQSYTLEIHDHVESPSINFEGMDCWTFFEACLCLGRMLESPKKRYQAEDLLREIEWTRYRNGKCQGNYLDRIHYLAEWYVDNEKRGNIIDLTRSFPNTRMENRCQEMSLLWKSYRYLKHNPQLRTQMAKQEVRLNRMPVYMIPKHKVSAIESQMQDGDIIGIARTNDGSYCSHVGIIIKDSKGQSRFMHASTTHKKIIVDSTISGYLNGHDKHAGILLARPK